MDTLKATTKTAHLPGNLTTCTEKHMGSGNGTVNPACPVLKDITLTLNKKEINRWIHMAPT
jgi:hypothetical protein